MNAPAITGLLTLEALQQKVPPAKWTRWLSASPITTAGLWGSGSTRVFSSSGGGHGTHACNYLLTVDMEMEPVPG